MARSSSRKSLLSRQKGMLECMVEASSHMSKCLLEALMAAQEQHIRQTYVHAAPVKKRRKK